MRSIGIAMVLIFAMVLSGCSSVSRIPVEQGKSGTGLVMTTVSDPHALATTVQRSWMDICKVTASVPLVRGFLLPEWDYTYEDCRPLGNMEVTTSSGYISGVAGPLLYSGAAVGAAALIGDGLSKSGPTVNQTGGGATQSQSIVPKHLK